MTVGLCKDVSQQHESDFQYLDLGYVHIFCIGMHSIFIINGAKEINLFLVHYTFVTVELETFIFTVFIRQCRFWPYPVFVLLYTITSSISPIVSLYFSKIISILCWNMSWDITRPKRILLKQYLTSGELNVISNFDSGSQIFAFNLEKNLTSNNMRNLFYDKSSDGIT